MKRSRRTQPAPQGEPRGSAGGRRRLLAALLGWWGLGKTSAAAAQQVAQLAQGAPRAAASPAAGGTVAVWLSAEGPGYTAMLESFRSELNRQPGIRLVSRAPDGEAAELEMRRSWPADLQMVVTVGVQATRQALAAEDLRVPVLAVLLPRVAFEELAGAARTRAPGRRVSAIFIDQPLNRQLELIRLAVPRLSRLVVLAGPASFADAERLTAAAEARSIEVVVERVSRAGEIYPALQRSLRGADALMVLPDSEVVNAAAAQNVLLTSSRLRVPVLGYSASYVRAGALLGVHSLPQQQGVEAAETVRQVLRGQALPAPRFPRLFNVAVNPQIAQVLGLSGLDEAALREQLQRLEPREGAGG